MQEDLAAFFCLIGCFFLFFWSVFFYGVVQVTCNYFCSGLYNIHYPIVSAVGENDTNKIQTDKEECLFLSRSL